MTSRLSIMVGNNAKLAILVQRITTDIAYYIKANEFQSELILLAYFNWAIMCKRLHYSVIIIKYRSVLRTAQQSAFNPFSHDYMGNKAQPWESHILLQTATT